MAESVRSSDHSRLSAELRRRRSPQRSSAKSSEKSTPIAESPATQQCSQLQTSEKSYGVCSSSRVLLYVVLGTALLSAIAVVDVLNGGPYGELIMPLIDYALPVMNDPDLGKSAREVVQSRGFEFESHEVTSADGYISEIHRVFHKDFTNNTKPALVFGLPLFCSSVISLIDYRNNTAAYQFADAGYDVWLLNARGNRFGMRHVSLDPEKDKLAFYNYSYLDIAEFDCSAQIDYVLNHTGQSKVYVAGVSQGATTFFTLLSKRPEYNSKIHAIASYGGFRSVCWAKDLSVILLTKLAWLFSDFILKFESLAAIWPYAKPMDRFCLRTGKLCGTVLVYTGFKSDHYLNVSRMGVYLEHIPAGTSLKNFVYYAQTGQKGCDGSVREFDYDQGPLTSLLIALGLRQSGNMIKYGTPKPPLLDPKNIKVPIKLYYSDGDDFVPKEEMLKMAKDIGIPLSNLHRLADGRFSHVNFVFNKGRMDFVQHTIDFFQGGNATWTGGEPDFEPGDAY